jgi:hypothetical protein
MFEFETTTSAVAMLFIDFWRGIDQYISENAVVCCMRRAREVAQVPLAQFGTVGMSGTGSPSKAGVLTDLSTNQSLQNVQGKAKGFCEHELKNK